MVSISKKEQIQAENISINKKNVPAEGLDGVFAELFSLAELKPNNVNKVQNDTSIIPNINNKTETKHNNKKYNEKYK